MPQGYSDLIIGLSANDPWIEQYQELALKYKVIAKVFNTNSTTEIFNELWKENPGYYCYHMTNDDVIYKTKGWDCVFITILFAKGGGIAYGDDSFHGSQLCTLPVISHDIIECLGWLQHPSLDKLFGDAVWMHIGGEVPCLYFHHQMILEHKHWINGKREKDSTAEEYLIGYRNDEFKYNIWRANLANGEIERVKTMFKKKEEENANLQGNAGLSTRSS